MLIDMPKEYETFSLSCVTVITIGLFGSMSMNAKFHPCLAILFRQMLAEDDCQSGIRMLAIKVLSANVPKRAINTGGIKLGFVPNLKCW